MPRPPEIQRLDVISAGTEILALLRAAYEVEARLIGVTTFPPLERTLADLRQSDATFFGYTDEVLLGVLELEPAQPPEIASLGVHPDAFRRGIGRALVAHVLEEHPRVNVHTAADNAPARQLYEGLGFKVTHTYPTPEGIRMVKLTIGALPHSP